MRASPPVSERRAILLGAAAIVASELSFASMGAAVKAASTSLPNEMIVFMRNAVGAAVLLPLLMRGGLPSLRTAVPQLHLLRALLGLSAMYCFFYALGELSLAHGMLLKMTSPIFIPLIAWLWLREGTPPLAAAAVPVGFAGVALVLKPDGAFEWATLVALLGGFLAAVAKITVRRLSRTEPTIRIVFYFALIATAVSAIPLAWSWTQPGPTQWGLLVLCGLLGTAGQLLLTRGYALASPSRISPFTYFSVVFGSLYGYAFWNEVPDSLFVIGAVLIAAAGVLAVRGRLQPLASRAAAAAD